MLEDNVIIKLQKAVIEMHKCKLYMFKVKT